MFIMKKIFCILLSGFVLLAASCAGKISKDQSVDIEKNTNNLKKDNIKNKNNMGAQQKVLVAYFSHAGENYSVGVIKKGNTKIIAEMIANQMHGDLFEMMPVNDYSSNYKVCVKTAAEEKRQNARPALKSDTIIESYDVIFIGYPNWCGDMPMIVYTFLEKHNWQGKTVIPFCTNEGSGLSDTEHSIAKSCKGATTLPGLSLRGAVAQNEQEKALQQVTSWLNKLGF